MDHNVAADQRCEDPFYLLVLWLVPGVTFKFCPCESSNCRFSEPHSQSLQNVSPRAVIKEWDVDNLLQYNEFPLETIFLHFFFPTMVFIVVRIVVVQPSGLEFSLSHQYVRQNGIVEFFVFSLRVPPPCVSVCSCQPLCLLSRSKNMNVSWTGNCVFAVGVNGWCLP